MVTNIIIKKGGEGGEGEEEDEETMVSINHLSLYLKELKTELTQPKVLRGKEITNVRAEIMKQKPEKQ